MDVMVETDRLAAQLGDADQCIIDASWFLPTDARTGRESYLEGHIPGAVFFDIDDVADRTSGLPHTLPTAEAFAEAVGALGISNDSRVIVYDAQGVISAPRVWWMFRTFGHDRVAVLNGGQPKWIAEGRPMESGEKTTSSALFSARLKPAQLRDVDAVRGFMDSGAEQIVDARSAGRYSGTEPEPRAGVRSGHIPGSVNLPFTELLAHGQLQTPDGVRAALACAGVSAESPITASCGSGVTACVLGLALSSIGNENWAVYDGSWTEWGSRDDLPIEPAS